MIAHSNRLRKPGGGDWSPEDIVHWGPPPPDPEGDREATLDDLKNIFKTRRH